MLCCDARPLAELQETPADSLEIPEVHDLAVLEDSYSNVVMLTTNSSVDPLYWCHNNLCSVCVKALWGIYLRLIAYSNISPPAWPLKAT